MQRAHIWNRGWVKALPEIGAYFNPLKHECREATSWSCGVCPWWGLANRLMLNYISTSHHLQHPQTGLYEPDEPPDRGRPNIWLMGQDGFLKFDTGGWSRSRCMECFGDTPHRRNKYVMWHVETCGLMSFGNERKPRQQINRLWSLFVFRCEAENS